MGSMKEYIVDLTSYEVGERSLLRRKASEYLNHFDLIAGKPGLYSMLATDDEAKALRTLIPEIFNNII